MRKRSFWITLLGILGILWLQHRFGSARAEQDITEVAPSGLPRMTFRRRMIRFWFGTNGLEDWDRRQAHLPPLEGGSIYSYGIGRGAIMILLVMLLSVVIVLAADTNFYSHPSTPIAATVVPVVGHACQSGFPACPFAEIVAAIKAAHANDEVVPCTFAVVSGVETPNNTADPACRIWLFGNQK